MKKIKFDFKQYIKQYKGKESVVHCKTEQEAELWCKSMHEHGLEWCNGNSYLDSNNWDDY